MNPSLKEGCGGTAHPTTTPSLPYAPSRICRVVKDHQRPAGRTFRAGGTHPTGGTRTCLSPPPSHDLEPPRLCRPVRSLRRLVRHTHPVVAAGTKRNEQHVVLRRRDLRQLPPQLLRLPRRQPAAE